MIHNYERVSPQEQYIWLWLYLFIGLFIGYCGYELGYTHAQTEYSKPAKYRCHDGVLYRGGSHYWEKTGQECKTLEEIKA